MNFSSNFHHVIWFHMLKTTRIHCPLSGPFHCGCSRWIAELKVTPHHSWSRWWDMHWVIGSRGFSHWIRKIFLLFVSEEFGNDWYEKPNKFYNLNIIISRKIYWVLLQDNKKISHHFSHVQVVHFSSVFHSPPEQHEERWLSHKDNCVITWM